MYMIREEGRKEAEGSINTGKYQDARQWPILPHHTIIAFTDVESIIRKYNVITKKLLAPRPLYLADSILTSLIIDYFTA